MDIQEEKDAYLSELLAREAISQDEFDDIIFRPSVNAFKSLYLSARFIDNINWGWNSWQAAKAQAVHEQVLDAPACVGGGTFQKGVKWSTVIAAAQRHFKYTQNAKKAPSLDIDQVKKLVSGDFVLVPKERLAKAVDGIEELFEEDSLLALGELLPIQQDLKAMIEAQEQK